MVEAAAQSHIAMRDWIQIGTMLVALGVFIQQSRSTRTLVDQHSSRLDEVEKQSQKTAILQERTTDVLAKLEERLLDHIETASCAEHRATLEFLQDEYRHLRSRIDAPAAS